jgi:DNA-binding NarL/FixJ family response regulator
MVVHADASECHRIGLVLQSWGHRVVGRAGSSATALDVLGTAAPQVALVGMNLLDANGSRLVRELLAADPGLGVVLVLGQSSADARKEAIASGARGLALRSGQVADLASAVATVGEGGRHFAPRVNRD